MKLKWKRLDCASRIVLDETVRGSALVEADPGIVLVEADPEIVRAGVDPEIVLGGASPGIVLVEADPEAVLVEAGPENAVVEADPGIVTGTRDCREENRLEIDALIRRKRQTLQKVPGKENPK
ncbi:unnamed protein product [Gongylonema pulchrum]|uniref:Carbon storage regulator n=1 Tax=Gongylonema pulchrum TaxID=637853 RepID=A0A183DM33_9BILA|nr:unnamed protein product [Gongylonema pulchrum]